MAPGASSTSRSRPTPVSYFAPIPVDIEDPIQDFISCLEKIKKRGGVIYGLSGLPKAFSVVNENLPLVLTTATSIESQLRAQTEAQRERTAKELPLIKEFATRGHQQALLIRNQLAAATFGADAKTNMAKYRDVVSQEGMSVEKAMETLLEIMKNLCSTSFVDREFGARIEHAAKQVREAEPSVPEEMASGKGNSYTFNHSGSGNMAVHAGRGDQNNHYGAPLAAGTK